MPEYGGRDVDAVFEFGGRPFGGVHSPYLIAEMACSHGGDSDRAKRLIDAAAEAEVDAVQVQIFRSSEQVAPDHELRPVLEQLELSDAAWREVIEYGKGVGDLAVFVFVYDTPSLELALTLQVDGLKLSSADLSNPEMLSAAAESGLPTTIGTGASTLDEILAALTRFASGGGQRAILMHGVQNFPTPLAHANVARIGLLRHVFGVPVGYQDHTSAEEGIARWIDMLALAQGAVVLEKHLTMDRSERITDWQAALEPDELRAWALAMRSAAEAMGSPYPQPLGEAEEQYRRFQKKTVVAGRHLEPGDVVGSGDLRFMRAQAVGVSPMAADALIGRVARTAIRKGDPITAEQLEGR